MSFCLTEGVPGLVIDQDTVVVQDEALAMIRHEEGSGVKDPEEEGSTVMV